MIHLPDAAAGELCFWRQVCNHPLQLETTCEKTWTHTLLHIVIIPLLHNLVAISCSLLFMADPNGCRQLQMWTLSHLHILGTEADIDILTRGLRLLW